MLPADMPFISLPALATTRHAQRNTSATKPRSQPPFSCSGFRTAGKQTPLPQLWAQRPPVATGKLPISPVGSATSATSFVTVVGSVTISHSDAMRVPRAHGGEHKVNDKGLVTPPTTPEEDNNKDKTAMVPSRPPPSVVVGPTVPMRRSSTLNRKARRKRGPIIPNAAATVVASKVAAKGAVFKASGEVPSHPPVNRIGAPRQQSQFIQTQSGDGCSSQLECPLSEEANRPPPPQLHHLPQLQEEPQVELAIRLATLSPRQNATQFATHNQGRIKRFLTYNDVYVTHVEANHVHKFGNCARVPIGSCCNPARGKSLFCREHACRGINLDLEPCGGPVSSRQGSVFCTLGYHPEAGQGRGKLLEQYMALGKQSAVNSQHLLALERAKVFTIFESQFGELLETPLVLSPITTHTASRAIPATETTKHEYEAFKKPEAPWGSIHVDKWWEGNWRLQVAIPLELQLKAEDYHLRRFHSATSPRSVARKQCPISAAVYGFPCLPSPALSETSEPIVDPHLCKYSELFRSRSSWESGRPVPLSELKRYRTYS